MDRFSVETTAAIAGFPRGTLGQMVARSLIPGFPYEPADVCSLLLARRLRDQGMGLEPACAIAFAMRDVWAEVIVRDGELGHRPQYVVAAESPPGVAEPYTWVLSPASDDLVDFIAAAPGGTAFMANASEIVATVLLSLRDAKPARHRVTDTGALVIRGRRKGPVRSRSRARLS